MLRIERRFSLYLNQTGGIGFIPKKFAVMKRGASRPARTGEAGTGPAG
jgi:hypothetical protein